MESPQLTLKFSNEDGEISPISLLLYLCMIAEQFDFAYEIVGVAKEPGGDTLTLKPYRPQRFLGHQFSLIDMTDDNEQIAAMLLGEDECRSKMSTRARDGQKQLHRLGVLFSINGQEFQEVAEPPSLKSTPAHQPYDLPSRTSPLELNCLDLRRNQLIIQEKCQTAVDLDATFSSKAGLALKELNAYIEIREVFDGWKSRATILNYSGRELAELIAKIFSNVAILYEEETVKSGDK